MTLRLRDIFSTDHKVIGLQFLFMGLGFFALGGLLAMAMRWQLAWPGATDGMPMPLAELIFGWPNGQMPPDVYNATFSLHATVMIFLVIIPLLVGAFGNYLIPLKIGAPRMAFPVLGGLSVWTTLLAGAVLFTGPFLPGGAVETGWTGYPPLSAIWGAGSAPQSGWPVIPLVMVSTAALFLWGFVATNVLRSRWAAVPFAVIAAVVTVLVMQGVAFDGQACWFVSLLLVGIATLLGAINYLATIVLFRCPGMTPSRLPLSVWSLLFTAVLVLLATPVLTGALVMNLLDHHRLTSFFLPGDWLAESRVHPAVAGGGSPLLHQHLFWFYSHPAVYIMILPAFGMVSDILSVFARKPVFGYRPMIYALAAITFLGFFVWAHHMFQSGMNPALGTAFALSTMFIAVPSGIKVFNWLGTLWGGNIHFTTAMWNAVAFVSLFVIGGLSGLFLASTAVNVHLHDTYFVVAHIHYVLFGGSTFGLFAAIYYWYPKFFGRMMNETLGKVHFFGSYVAFNCVFFPMHILGIRGVPRRYFDISHLESFKDLQPLNVFITISAFALGVAQLPLVVNFFGSLIWGKAAPANPWNATTLEWTDAASPPIRENFESRPSVYHGAYEYNNPLSGDDDFLPQSRPVS
ncbi:MAG TPA: cbb3-type cytochrome c oxidase subunit I [Tepidisphaeraceae bacterium]|jgi:cytochrome c oxidase subunit 1|nr:cbb3-type cytochrome c oxidase subunit I [Tepidisphaeraceae bacterium]